ncbi:MAG: methyltransferase domain-containing protein [Acidobacteria bacterium]|nr:methyltransferase domain-containing protein [Acidobacteriota bacterium]
MSSSLAQRHRVPEVMDDPGLDRARHEAALAGLARLNRLAAPARAIWRGVRSRLGAHEPLRILDLGCGSGDVSLAAATHAAEEALFVELTGCDLSDVATDIATSTETPSRVEARFVTCDALDLAALRTLEVRPHIVMTSLFMHHLDPRDAVTLMGNMRALASDLVVVDDLIRDRVGYVLAAVGSRLLTRSDVVHTDALRSVRAAFSPTEVLGLAREAGLEDITLSRHWPARFLMMARGAA